MDKAIEDGIGRGGTADGAVVAQVRRGGEAAWLTTHELTEETLREEASDWGTGIAVWESDLKP